MSDCRHTSVEKVYLDGRYTGDLRCQKCLKVMSPDERARVRFNFKKEDLKEQLVRLFDTEWLHLKMLKGHTWNREEWNEGASPAQIGMNVFYLLCHGPWLPPRIKQLEIKVEKVLTKPDRTFDELVACYPLSWQRNLAHCLKPVWDDPQLFGSCASYKPITELATKEIFRRINLTRRYKVVDIWLGRNLGIPSFPIDRHIQRELDRVKLNVSYMGFYEEFLAALQDLGYDPVLLEWQLINSVKHD